MKITDVKTYVVGNPPPHFGGRYFIFLKLTTDSGVEGILQHWFRKVNQCCKKPPYHWYFKKLKRNFSL